MKRKACWRTESMVLGARTVLGWAGDKSWLVEASFDGMKKGQQG